MQTLFEMGLELLGTFDGSVAGLLYRQTVLCVVAILLLWKVLIPLARAILRLPAILRAKYEDFKWWILRPKVKIAFYESPIEKHRNDDEVTYVLKGTINLINRYSGICNFYPNVTLKGTQTMHPRIFEFKRIVDIPQQINLVQKGDKKSFDVVLSDTYKVDNAHGELEMFEGLPLRLEFNPGWARIAEIPISRPLGRKTETIHVPNLLEDGQFTQNNCP